MRIYYDGQNYFPPQGVGRYYRNIIERLPASWTPTMALTNLQLAELPSHPQLETVVGWTVPSLRAYLRFGPLRTLAARQLRPKVRRVHYDVAHPTYYELLTGGSAATLDGPVVVTVYDMIHERFPELDPTGRVRAAKRAAVGRADAILCISEHTRDDLVELLGVAADRTVVTPLAADLDREHARPGPVPRAPYLLYVGGRAIHKNVGLLFRALARLPAELRLVVVGHPFTAAERQEIDRLGVAGRIEHVGRVADPDLARLYGHSVALVYPSLYEGFGIPPLEAMACGTAVVAARASSIPEVVGPAAALFDPGDVEALVDAISSVAGDPAGRQRLIEAGTARARQFSWDRTAESTTAVYRALGGP